MWVSNRRVMRAINQLRDDIMRTFAELSDDLNGISSDVTVVQMGVTGLRADLAALQNSLGTLPAAAQASLDAAVDKADNLKTAMDLMAKNFTATAQNASASADGQAAVNKIADPAASQPATPSAPPADLTPPAPPADLTPPPPAPPADLTPQS